MYSVDHKSKSKYFTSRLDGTIDENASSFGTKTVRVTSSACRISSNPTASDVAMKTPNSSGRDIMISHVVVEFVVKSSSSSPTSSSATVGLNVGEAVVVVFAAVGANDGTGSLDPGVGTRGAFVGETTGASVVIVPVVGNCVGGVVGVGVVGTVTPAVGKIVGGVVGVGGTTGAVVGAPAGAAPSVGNMVGGDTGFGADSATGAFVGDD
mmetsp:Transcript_56144/g.136013  ORF Transcript_56144/g.136013 Transcript_56144/m.136013 type:complete len:209 (+) Transcript_56144:3382-4008(+)